MIDAVVGRLRPLQPEIEAALAFALEGLTEEAATWNAFERIQSLEDLLALSAGKDAMYDRPTVGAMYALWYHAKRTHDAVRALLPSLCQSDGDLTIVDVGAGTGATWWACGLIERCRIECGWPRRKLEVIAIEPSLSMLRTADRMWRTACDGDLLGEASIDVEQRHASLAMMPRTGAEVIGYAGYLFDASDRFRATDVGELLASVLEGLNARRLIVTGNRQKSELMAAAVDEICRRPGWQRSASTGPSPAIWAGQIPSLGALRERLTEGFPLRLLQLGVVFPDWASNPQAFTLDLAQGGQATLALGSDRGGLLFDAAQEAAAEPNSGPRPTAVIGAAGSGKSRVLVERLVRTVEQSRTTDDAVMLVTTFNSQLRDQLFEWLPRGMRREAKGTSRRPKVKTVAGGEVEFLTWDQVVLDVLGAKPQKLDSDVTALERRLAHQEGPMRDFIDAHEWLDAEFLAAELKRVVYGLKPCTIEEYLTVVRSGIGKRLDKHQRKKVWQLLMEPPADCWTYRRIQALERARMAPPRRYSHVFVDECQDFTAADFELLGSLVRAGGEIVVFGDTTQGLHIGNGYGRSRTLNNHRWREHRLERSYRLPLRICEALEPIAGRIEERRLPSNRAEAETEEREDTRDATDTALPKAVKNAVAGVRPIILAGSRSQVGPQLTQIVDFYKPLLKQDGDHHPVITIAEEHGAEGWVRRALREVDLLDSDRVVPETMLKIKGLERPMVIWATGAQLAGLDTHPEWIYTICTRTTGLLVIVLQDHTTLQVKRVVRRLELSRLLFWTEEARSTFDSWVQGE